METRIFRVTHSDGGWLNAELRTDINDGFAIVEARERFGASVVSCEQLPDDHPAVRRHTERLIAESNGVPVITEAPRKTCKYAPAGRFCDNAINAELLEALEGLEREGWLSRLERDADHPHVRHSEAGQALKTRIANVRAALAKARGEA